MATVTYYAPDISCQGCANAIKRAVSPLPGVREVGVDVNTKRVVVDYDENRATPEEIKERIEDAGYETTAV